MNEKRLKFNDVEVIKKEFHTFKQPITLSLVDIDKIIISDKFKHIDKSFKYFICYKEDDIIEIIKYCFTSMEWIHKIF